VYNVIYSDGKSGRTFAKRFNLPGVTRDKEYDLTQGHPNSKIHYVTGNPNGEAETVEVKLSPASTARKKIFEYDFSELEVKGRSSRGNTITHYPVRKVDFVKAGASTLSKIDLWYDEASGRLNKDGRGRKLGKFDGDDQIIAFQRNGSYKITSFELSNRYDPEKTLHLEKFNPKKAVSAVYVDGESKQYMVKRFMIETSTADKEFGFISEGIGSRLVVVSTAESPEIEMEVQKAKDKPKKIETVTLDEIVDIKGWKALGNRLSEYKVTKVNLVQDEETGLEEGDEDNDLIEAAESEKDSQSPKKKYETNPTEERNDPNQWLDRGEQAKLFAAPEKPKHQVQPRPAPKPKIKAEQQDLFGAEQKSQQSQPLQKNEESEEEIGPADDSTEKDKGEDKSFGVGETIEFDI
jgi:topoisomerase-4 subunit A